MSIKIDCSLKKCRGQPQPEMQQIGLVSYLQSMRRFALLGNLGQQGAETEQNMTATILRRLGRFA